MLPQNHAMESLALQLVRKQSSVNNWDSNYDYYCNTTRGVTPEERILLEDGMEVYGGPPMGGRHTNWYTSHGGAT